MFLMYKSIIKEGGQKRGKKAHSIGYACLVRYPTLSTVSAEGPTELAWLPRLPKVLSQLLDKGKRVRATSSRDDPCERDKHIGMRHYLISCQLTQ